MAGEGRMTSGSIAERVYRALLGLYPGAFRNRFGDEMVQLFADQLRDARRPQARAATVRTWIRTLADLALTAVSEHAHQDRLVAQSLAEPPSRLGRLLGAVGVLGGGILIAAFVPLVPWNGDLFNLRLVLFNAGAIAIALVIHRRQSRGARRLALSGTVPVVLANALYAALVVRVVSLAGEPGPGDYGRLFGAAAAFLWLADGWFGFVIMRIARVSRWPGLALGMGSILALCGMGQLGLVSGDFGQAFVFLSLVGIALNGIAWIALGLQVAFGGRRGRGVASGPVPSDTQPSKDG